MLLQKHLGAKAVPCINIMQLLKPLFSAAALVVALKGKSAQRCRCCYCWLWCCRPQASVVDSPHASFRDDLLPRVVRPCP
jgi:hypothetical protein